MDKKTIAAHKISDEEYEKILKILGREPNLLELGIFSAMWSEHCSYKSSKKYLAGSGLGIGFCEIQAITLSRVNILFILIRKKNTTSDLT